MFDQQRGIKQPFGNQENYEDVARRQAQGMKNAADIGYGSQSIKSQSPIKESLDRAEQRLAKLQELVNDLIMQLEPVMKPSETPLGFKSSDAGPETGINDGCQISSRIDAQAYVTAMLTSQLAEARVRLCV